MAGFVFIETGDAFGRKAQVCGGYPPDTLASAMTPKLGSERAETFTVQHKA